MDDRIQTLAELWCKWNTKELDGRDFALAFHKLFRSECTAAWNIREGLCGEDARIYKLSEAYFQESHLTGIKKDKARMRRFQIVEALPDDLIQVRRLDSGSNGIERIHKSFLVAEEARDA